MYRQKDNNVSEGKSLEGKKDREKKEIKKGNPNNGTNRAMRDAKGRVLPGNTLASNRGKIAISAKTLLDSLREAEKAHKKPLMRHIWDVAYKDNKFLAKVLDKFIANKGIDISKFTGAGQFNVIIQTYGGNKDDKPVNIDITPDQGDAESKE